MDATYETHEQSLIRLKIAWNSSDVPKYSKKKKVSYKTRHFGGYKTKILLENPSNVAENVYFRWNFELY